MTAKSNITPTSTLTPLDLLPQSGPVDYFKGHDFAIDASKNFKQLGSFWTRQLAPEARKHAKALSLTGITTNALTDVQNVKNNLANDSENLYFNNMVVPIEGLLKVQLSKVYDDYETKFNATDIVNNLLGSSWESSPAYTKTSSAPTTYAFTITGEDSNATEISSWVYIWRLSKDIVIEKISHQYGEFKRNEHFYQFGRWVFIARHIGIVGEQTHKSTYNIHQLFQKNLLVDNSSMPLCSGSYPSNSYFGQSFYKTLFNLEYLPAGPGAKLVADYISGKNQNPVSFEIMLNSIVGLEATIGRNASTVIDSNPVNNLDDPQPADQIQKQYIKFEDKVTGDKYQLPCYGDSELTKGKLVPTNTFPQYLVKLYSKPEIDAENFKRVSLHSDDSLTIDLLSGGSLAPKLGTEKEYTGEELKSIIIKDLNAVLIIHLGKISDWVSYHKYMSTRSDYFKYHFPTHNELINYVIRTTKEYTPITYVPLFTCTWEDGNTTDYKYFLYKNS